MQEGHEPRSPIDKATCVSVSRALTRGSTSINPAHIALSQCRREITFRQVTQRKYEKGVFVAAARNGGRLFVLRVKSLARLRLAHKDTALP